MNYREYITSPLWVAQREHAFQIWGHRCQACGSSEKVEGHHLSYGGFAAIKASDIMPLCDSCHTLVHGMPDFVEGLKRCPNSASRRDIIVSFIRSLSKPKGRDDNKWKRVQEQLRKERLAAIGIKFSQAQSLREENRLKTKAAQKIEKKKARTAKRELIRQRMADPTPQRFSFSPD